MLISGVLLYRTFAIFETNDKYDVMNGRVEDPGDIYFAFYKDGVIQKEMPKKDEGYWLDEEKSYCGVLGKKDETMKPTLDRDTWSIVVTGMKTSRTKCNLYFIKTYDETTLFDLSGNKYNGTFKDGAKVQEDEEGNLGIYFDGINGYVDIVDLPESINWEDGFSVEFEAKWFRFGYYSRILDFSNGPDSDNIAIANRGETNVLTFFTRYGNYSISGYHGYQENEDSTVIIDENQKASFKLILKKENNMINIYIYKNNEYIDNISYQPIDTDHILRNVLRTENYLGNSPFIKIGYYDKIFNGYIYSLKITDAENHIILWYDF